MDHYDDIQIEEYYPSDFVEEIYDDLFDENDNDKSFQQLITSNHDFWLWLLTSILSQEMLTPTLVLLLSLRRLFFFIGFFALTGAVLIVHK